MLGFDDIRGSVTERRMEVAGVVGGEPAVEGFEESGRTGPLVQPHQLLFQGPQEALGVGVALGIAVAGEGLADAQGGAGAHEGERGWLTAVIGHQVHALALDAIWELLVHGAVQSHQPVPGARLQAGIVADHLLAVPVEHDYQVDPAEALDHDLGHVDSPPFVGPGRPRLPGIGLALGAQPGVRPDQEVGRLHEAVDALLVDHQAVDVAQMRPDPAVAPEWVLGLELAQPLEQLRVARRHLGVRAAPHPRISSLFLSSRVSSPTRLLRRAFSRSSRPWRCGAPAGSNAFAALARSWSRHW